MLGNRHLRAQPLFVPILILLVLVTASCGRREPSFAPGSLSVQSDPPGAAILIDGLDTGQVTPFTFAELEAGSYEVTVALPSFVPAPASRLIEIQPLSDQTTTFALSQTGLQIESDPPGALIIVDGQPTGLVTPAVVPGVTAGIHEVGLELSGYRIFPSSRLVEIPAGEVVTVPASSFLVRSARTVLMEGFTNIFCNGCPEMSQDLHALQLSEGFGTDRALTIKYSMSWPLLIDPHYQYNISDNDGRLEYYGPQNLWALPSLYRDGVMVGSPGNPPDLQGMKNAVAENLQADPGFLIDVTADLSDRSVPATVTLTALDRDVDLGGYSLLVALVQSRVDYSEPPVQPNLGETTFYWVLRDMADEQPSLPSLEAAVPRVFELQLARDDWDTATIEVIAFVQHDQDHSIIQAGSTMVTPLSQAPGAVIDEGNTR